MTEASEVEMLLLSWPGSRSCWLWQQWLSHWKCVRLTCGLCLLTFPLAHYLKSNSACSHWQNVRFATENEVNRLAFMQSCVLAVVFAQPHYTLSHIFQYLPAVLVEFFIFYFFWCPWTISVCVDILLPFLLHFCLLLLWLPSVDTISWIDCHLHSVWYLTEVWLSLWNDYFWCIQCQVSWFLFILFYQVFKLLVPLPIFLGAAGVRTPKSGIVLYIVSFICNTNSISSLCSCYTGINTCFQSVYVILSL